MSRMSDLLITLEEQAMWRIISTFYNLRVSPNHVTEKRVRMMLTEKERQLIQDMDEFIYEIKKQLALTYAGL